MANISAANFARNYKRRPYEAMQFASSVLETSEQERYYSETSIIGILSYNFLSSPFSILGKNYVEALKTLCPGFYSSDWKGKTIDDGELLELRYFTEVIQNLAFQNNDHYDDRPKKRLFQALDVLVKTLSDYGYDMIKTVRDDSSKYYVSQKKDAVAEDIAAIAPANVKDAIIDYLCAKNHDEKYDRLNRLIDIEEKSKKGLPQNLGGQDVLKRVSLYIQLLRHPEENKDKPEYGWFYKDGISDQCLDDLFHLAICIDSFKEAKDITDRFDAKTGQQTNTK